MLIYKSDDDIDVCAATLYAEARGEKIEGQIWVVWVIRNRQIKKQKQHGIEFSFKDICLEPQQFECWDGKSRIYIDDKTLNEFESCKRIINFVMAQAYSEDPTRGCDHYNNVEKETKIVNGRKVPDYMDERGYSVIRREKIDNHQFYQSKAGVFWKPYKYGS